MLVLQRHPGESIRIGADVEVHILSVGRNQVKIGVVAPREVEIYRSELEESNRRAIMPDWRNAGLAELAQRLKKQEAE
ncbi:MAG: carbon storage regulator [Acidobacteria bacterium]|nr:carbon storage regulator [Acidobacteriota bacterium]